MPSIFSVLDEIADQYLGLDETWRGQSPRFMHRETLLRLCSGSGADVDGVGLIHELFDQILRNWSMVVQRQVCPVARTGGSRSGPILVSKTLLQRFFGANHRCRGGSRQLANQVPVDSGLLSGSPHWIDLVFRSVPSFI